MPFLCRRGTDRCRAPCRHSSTRRTSEYNGVHFHQGTPNSMDQFDCPHAKDQNSCKGFSRKLCLTVREERDHRRSLNDWHFYDQITSKRKDPRILLGTFLRTDVQAVKEAYFAKIPVIVLRDAKRRPRVLMWRCLPTARGRNPSPCRGNRLSQKRYGTLPAIKRSPPPEGRQIWIRTSRCRFPWSPVDDARRRALRAPG